MALVLNPVRAMLRLQRERQNNYIQKAIVVVAAKTKALCTHVLYQHQTLESPQKGSATSQAGSPSHLSDKRLQKEYYVYENRDLVGTHLHTQENPERS